MLSGDEKRESGSSCHSMCDFRNHVPDNHVVIFRVMVAVIAETAIGTATDQKGRTTGGEKNVISIKPRDR